MEMEYSILDVFCGGWQSQRGPADEGGVVVRFSVHKMERGKPTPLEAVMALEAKTGRDAGANPPTKSLDTLRAHCM